MTEPTILVIDDSELIRLAARIGLEQGGWRVTLAESGAEGLSAAQRERPAAILLDVVMPDLDGVATLAALRAEPETAGIPVIFLTGRPDEAAGQADSVAGVIAKPFAPLELSDQVNAMLAQP